MVVFVADLAESEHISSSSEAVTASKWDGVLRTEGMTGQVGERRHRRFGIRNGLYIPN